MQLQEALVQLKAGYPMYRTGWQPQDGYIVFMPGMSHIWKIVLTPQPNAGNYIFSMEDLNASDWEMYTGEKPVEGKVISSEE